MTGDRSSRRTATELRAMVLQRCGEHQLRLLDRRLFGDPAGYVDRYIAQLGGPDRVAECFANLDTVLPSREYWVPLRDGMQEMLRFVADGGIPSEARLRSLRGCLERMQDWEQRIERDYVATHGVDWTRRQVIDFEIERDAVRRDLRERYGLHRLDELIARCDDETLSGRSEASDPLVPLAVTAVRRRGWRFLGRVPVDQLAVVDPNGVQNLLGLADIRREIVAEPPADWPALVADRVGALLVP